MKYWEAIEEARKGKTPHLEGYREHEMHWDGNCIGFWGGSNLVLTSRVIDGNWVVPPEYKECGYDEAISAVACGQQVEGRSSDTGSWKFVYSRYGRLQWVHDHHDVMVNSFHKFRILLD